MNGVKRGRLTSWIVMTAVVIGLAIAGVWLSKRGSARTGGSNSSAIQSAKEEAGPSGLVQFRDGSTLEILGMCESTPESAAAIGWWGVDGRVVELDPNDPDFRPFSSSRRATTDPTQRVVEARYHIYAASALKFRWFYYDFPGEVRESAWRFTSPTDRKGLLSISLPADLDRGDARIGQGFGGFVAKVTADVTLSPTPTLTIRDAKNASATATTQAARVTFGEVTDEGDGELKIEFFDFRSPKEQATTAAELAAISNNGKRTVITDSLHRQKPNPMHFRVRTENLKSVVYLTRGIEWHTLKNVKFRPTTRPAK